MYHELRKRGTRTPLDGVANTARSFSPNNAWAIPRAQPVREDAMSKTMLLPLIAAALLCSAPATAQQAQQDFPDGPGKEIIVSTCGGCHNINRVRAGYTADGWRTVIQM